MAKLQQKIKIVVGLGNIGEEYVRTRHNIGFMCLDYLARTKGLTWQEKARFKAFVSEYMIDDTKVICAKPTTYMNLSGEAVQALAQFYKVELTDIVIVHDELDLNFGTIRTRIGGHHAGNNGIRSISGSIGSDYARIRCGIANEHLEQIGAVNFVLGRFSAEEQRALPAIAQEASELIENFITERFTAHTITL